MSTGDDFDELEPEDLDPTCLGDQQFEDALEPRHLIRRAAVVMHAGVLMLGAGTSSLRVRELMRRAAHALGLDDMQASIGYTDITLTVSRRGIFRTHVGETTTPGVNAHRIALLQRLSLTMPGRTTATALANRLAVIEATPPLYPVWLLTIAVALACGSITALNQGSWREIAAVLPASALAYLVNRFLGKHRINHLAVVIISATLASAGFIAFTTALDAAIGDHSTRMAAGFICASIFLIPGFPLVTGGLDLARIDLTAGIPRIAYAAMVLLAMSIGVWLVASLAGVSPETLPLLDLGPVGTWLVRIAASFLAVCAWAMMFNSPLGVATAAGAVAVLANVPRLIMLDAGIANHIATFTGCVLIGLLCAVMGRIFSLEKIIMTVPTLLVSIPGASALQSMLYFDRADVTQAVGHAVSTVLVVISMVAGLAAARMLTDPEWTFNRPDAPSLMAVLRRSAAKAPRWRRKSD